MAAFGKPGLKPGLQHNINVDRMARGPAADKSQAEINVRDPRHKEKETEKWRQQFRDAARRNLREKMVWFHIIERSRGGFARFEEMFADELKRADETFSTFRYDRWGYYYDDSKGLPYWGPHVVNEIDGVCSEHVHLLHKLSAQVRHHGIFYPRELIGCYEDRSRSSYRYMVA